MKEKGLKPKPQPAETYAGIRAFGPVMQFKEGGTTCSAFLNYQALVNELHRKLNNARVEGRRYLTKRAAGDASAWISELRGVQNVKELSAKFEPRFLTPEWRHFGKSQVKICPAGSSE